MEKSRFYLTKFFANLFYLTNVLKTSKANNLCPLAFSGIGQLLTCFRVTILEINSSPKIYYKLNFGKLDK